MKSLRLSLAAVSVLASISAHAEDATGYWTGVIANTLTVNVQFNKASDGRWNATLTAPQQGLETKVDNLAVTETQINFALTKLNAGFTAIWNDQEKVWTGTWSQQGQSVPLLLKRTDGKALKPKRPQEEAVTATPRNYTTSEVSFTNDTAKVTFAGTFSAPIGKGPFPAVVLVHGSGPLNRDEEIFDHKPFLVLADHLNRQGIAVLRYDKRGIGKSSGIYKGATTFDLAGDAEAAVRYLRGRSDVAARHIGLVGHSEGAMIAPLIASRDPALGFVVMLAGPGVRGELLMVEQIALMAKSSGAPDDVIAKGRVLNKAMFAALASEPDLEAANKRALLVIQEAERKGTLPEGMGKDKLAQFSTPWFHAFLRHEPGPVLQAIQQPILVLNGELDMQVPADMDLAAIRAALKGNPRAVVKKLPKLNHLFQTATTGSGGEYFSIQETIAPIALNTVSDWIRATVR